MYERGETVHRNFRCHFVVIVRNHNQNVIIIIIIIIEIYQLITTDEEAKPTYN